MSTIFDLSQAGRNAAAQCADPEGAALAGLPEAALRTRPPELPEVSELQAVRHYTNLSVKNFSIDGQFYPLGSCTMKYNPRGAHRAASLSGFLGRHPLAPERASQGFMECLFALQEILKEVTGMAAVSLTPMAGAQGEFAGVAMIRAYHRARGDLERREILTTDAAHGTNPATAVMCGYTVREVAVDGNGDVDLDALKAAVGPQTAGLMMTNPSTCGVFERQAVQIAQVVHDAGGLLYYDGANLNAILGKVRPADMGFDVLHLNLHKTFATPHGGGGPTPVDPVVGEGLVPDSVGIEMIERLPDPDDLAIPRELDDHVAHHPLALPRGIGVGLAGVPVVVFAELGAHHDEVPVRELVDLVMHRQRRDRNAVRFSPRSIGGVPVSDAIAENVDFGRPVVSGHEREVAIPEGLDVADPRI